MARRDLDEAQARADIRDFALALRDGLRQRHETRALEVPRDVARNTIEWLDAHWNEIPRRVVKRAIRAMCLAALLFFVLMGAPIAAAWVWPLWVPRALAERAFYVACGMFGAQSVAVFALALAVTRNDRLNDMQARAEENERGF